MKKTKSLLMIKNLFIKREENYQKNNCFKTIRHIENSIRHLIKKFQIKETIERKESA